MKVFFCSDIHGSHHFAQLAIDAYLREKADMLVILGDLYYHGPRNPLTQEYDPMAVSLLLNEYKDEMLVIKGNCDSEVDEMISNFKFHQYMECDINGYTVAMQHGHIYNIDSLPSGNCDVFVYGHIHQGFISEKNGVIVANTGSTSLPKGGSANSYLIMDEAGLTLKKLNGEAITSYALSKKGK